MFCGHWDSGLESVLKENSGLGVFKGGCHAVSSLTTSLALRAAWIFVDVFHLLSWCIEEGRDLEGWVQWQDMVQHTLTQKCWVQAPDKTLCCASVNPAVKWG